MHEHAGVARAGAQGFGDLVERVAQALQLEGTSLGDGQLCPARRPRPLPARGAPPVREGRAPVCRRSRAILARLVERFDLQAQHSSVPIVLVDTCVRDRLVQQLRAVSGQVVCVRLGKQADVAVVSDILGEGPVAQAATWRYARARGSVARTQASLDPLPSGRWALPDKVTSGRSEAARVPSSRVRTSVPIRVQREGAGFLTNPLGKTTGRLDEVGVSGEKREERSISVEGQRSTADEVAPCGRKGENGRWAVPWAFNVSFTEPGMRSIRRTRFSAPSMLRKGTRSMLETGQSFVFLGSHKGRLKDPLPPRRLKKLRRGTERTFGASLLRLGKQRGLQRSDFAPISAKEIARLERNEVAKPHAKTLATVASRLGVRAEEIGSF